MRTASVCGVMDVYEHDEISKGFADLMAALEDAAAFAIEGQSAERTPVSLRSDIDQLWHMMIGCIGILASVERRLDEM